MKTLTFQDTMTLARMMAAGIRKHGEEISSLGIAEKDAEFLETMNSSLKEIDTRQEQLKADLKACTEQLSKTQSELTTELSRLKKLVKIAIPQSQWNDFGITDKR